MSLLHGLQNLVPAPHGLFEPKLKHLFVFPHQDDDLGYSGLLHRLHGSSTAVWVTNGDGLAPMEKTDPRKYAETRCEETRCAMKLLGFKDKRVIFLGHSEIYLYDMFRDFALSKGPDSVSQSLRTRAAEFFLRVKRELLPFVEEADVVWTVAWQGGHPEHDLTHFVTAMTLWQVASRQRRAIPMYELPEYELTYAIPLRFPPWKRGTVYYLDLTERELALKEKAFYCYKSQLHLISKFRGLISAYGLAATLVGRPFTFSGFATRETFAPVPLQRDYQLSPHLCNALDYMFEEHEGTRISFERSIAPMIRLGLSLSR